MTSPRASAPRRLATFKYVPPTMTSGAGFTGNEFRQDPLGLAQVPRRSQEHRIAPVDTRLLILHPVTGRLTVLSDSARRIYDAIDGRASIGELATKVHASIDTAARPGPTLETLTADVVNAVTGMLDEQVIELDGSERTTTPNASAARSQPERPQRTDHLPSSGGAPSGDAVRTVRVGAAVLTVATSPPEIASLIEGPLSLLPPAHHEERASTVTVSKSPPATNASPSPTYEVRTENGSVLSTGSVDLAAEMVLSTCNQVAVSQPRDAIRLHAGVVARNGEAVAICGTSGSGKSTLVAALTAAGWSYLTDEVAIIDSSSFEVTPYPKWVDLSPGSLDRLGIDPQSGIGPRGKKHHVPPAEFGTVGRGGTIVGMLLLAPTVAGDSDQPRELAGLEAVEAMLGNVFVNTWESPDSLQALVDLCGRTRALTMQRREIGLMVDAVNRLFP